jgi:hypothetical protein
MGGLLKYLISFISMQISISSLIAAMPRFKVTKAAAENQVVKQPRTNWSLAKLLSVINAEFPTSPPAVFFFFFFGSVGACANGFPAKSLPTVATIIKSQIIETEVEY